MTSDITDPAIQYIRDNSLAQTIANALGIRRQAVSQWRKVPAERVVAVAKVMRWKPYRVRPDVMPKPVPVPRKRSNRKMSAS